MPIGTAKESSLEGRLRMVIKQELLRKYFMKLEKDIIKEYNGKIQEAKKAEDYAKILKLDAEKDGAYHVLICLLRGCLINSRDEDVPRLVEKYLKTKVEG
jgi:hypothetical protein